MMAKGDDPFLAKVTFGGYLQFSGKKVPGTTGEVRFLHFDVMGGKSTVLFNGLAGRVFSRCKAAK